MANRRARTFDDKQFAKFMSFIDLQSPMPARDRLIAALSFKAGLRVGEISKIRIDAMLDATGGIADDVQVWSEVAKMNRERKVPMHALVRDSLQRFRDAYPKAEVVAISSQPFRWVIARGEAIPRKAEHRAMSYIATKTAYDRLLKDFCSQFGIDGVSTHSGRRTFGTNLARATGKFMCSIRDVQKYMGHADLKTTEAYVDLSPNARALIQAA